MWHIFESKCFLYIFLGYTLAVNHLADKTEKELKALYGKQYSGEYNGGKPFPYKAINKSSLPEQFDWRIYGAVTPVKGNIYQV